jgi:hypothetical protein
MAGGAGRVIPTSLLLAVLVTATSLRVVVVATANAPASGGGSVQAVGGGAKNRGISASRLFLATAAAATMRKTGRDRACGRGYPAGACSGGAGGGAAGEWRRLKCCGGLCTDVLASASNCGACGKRCAFGRLCCGGRCVAVAYDVENCGACGRACAHGLPCTYGMCGYA